MVRLTMMFFKMNGCRWWWWWWLYLLVASTLLQISPQTFPKIELTNLPSFMSVIWLNLIFLVLNSTQLFTLFCSLLYPQCKPYHVTDKALIIGDAAHAMVPFFAQGMNSVSIFCRYVINLIPLTVIKGIRMLVGSELLSAFPPPSLHPNSCCQWHISSFCYLILLHKC